MPCTLRDNILKFDRPVPRYTSYPTAPHFSPLSDKSVYSHWLRSIGDDEALSLYLHVPFCPKLCWYCGCNTKITRRYAPVEDYAYLMMREIDMLGAALGGKKQVVNIHFGGGSPGLLRACDFEKVMIKLREVFDIADNADIAIEIDPRGVSEGRAAIYAKYGVNRISLGAQDFDDKVLSAVNRQQPFHLSYEAVKLFRHYGIPSINLDLLYGLPHQTLDNMRATIDKALMLAPERISLFGYAHVPWMKKHMRLIDEVALPDKDLRFDLFDLASDLLTQAGYVAIGIDHFAKADDPLVMMMHNKTMRRNFQGYTADNGNILIGIGASSIGRLDGGYIQNAVDMPAYKKSVLAGELPVNKICVLRDDDKIRADIIEQIMCYMRVDLDDAARKYNLDGEYFAQAMDKLKPYIQESFVTICDKNILQINDGARPVTRLVAAAFDEYLGHAPETPRHAKAI